MGILHAHTPDGRSRTHTYTLTALCTTAPLLLLHRNRFGGIIILYGGKERNMFSMTTVAAGLATYLCIYVSPCLCICGC